MTSSSFQGSPCLTSHPDRFWPFPPGGLPLPKITQPLMQVEQTLSQDGSHHPLPLDSQVPGNCTQKTPGSSCDNLPLS